MVGIFDVAKTVCKMAGWNISQIELQKIMYILQMFHLGKNGYPLFYANFEAWQYGPVEPNLYQRLKYFGADAIPSRAFLFDSIVPDASDEGKFVNKFGSLLVTWDAPRLIRYTHEKLGAWKKIYKGGERHLSISNDDIYEKYNNRMKNGDPENGIKWEYDKKQ